MRASQRGVSWVVAAAISFLCCAHDAQPVLSMNDHVRSIGIEAARAEVQDCMDEAARLRELEPDQIAKEVACGVGLIAAEIAASNEVVSDLDRSVRTARRLPDSEVPCLELDQRKSFQVLVDPCLEEKGCKVLPWREQ